jgi:hypothetical protein
MGLADDLANLEPSRCACQKMLDNMPADDRKVVIAEMDAIAAGQRGHNVLRLHRILKHNNYSIGEGLLRAHIRKTCFCDRDT